MILADPSFGRLAPAWMIDCGIHVRIKAVLVGPRYIPRSRRLFLRQTNIHDRFDPFEAVLPRNHEADGRAVLVWKPLTVESYRQDSQRMHRFVDAQAFDVGPL